MGRWSLISWWFEGDSDDQVYTAEYSKVTRYRMMVLVTWEGGIATARHDANEWQEPLLVKRPAKCCVVISRCSLNARYVCRVLHLFVYKYIPGTAAAQSALFPCRVALTEAPVSVCRRQDHISYRLYAYHT